MPICHVQVQFMSLRVLSQLGKLRNCRHLQQENCFIFLVPDGPQNELHTSNEISILLDRCLCLWIIVHLLPNAGAVQVDQESKIPWVRSFIGSGSVDSISRGCEFESKEQMTKTYFRITLLCQTDIKHSEWLFQTMQLL